MMYSCDGDLLCYCDRQRLEWYVRKGIAEIINTNPYTIKYKFKLSNLKKLNR